MPGHDTHASSPRDRNIDPSSGRPCAKSCWHFAFRFHQDEATKDANGFMTQIEEKGGLGDGQKIETEMATEAGIKVFRTCMSPNQDAALWTIEKISNHIPAG